MSQATKRKHVVKEVLEEYVVPSERQQIVRVVGTPGNNLHEVETSEGTRFLVSMPTKFRKNIWIKRGDFLLVDPIEEGEKVKAEISFVLYKDHVRYLKKEGYWPEAFLGGVAGAQSSAKDSRDGPQSPPRSAGEEDSEDDDADLFVNTNRVNYNYLESEDSSDSDEEEK
ncbi:probable RNA-binding protein EIF1AD isoform X1 [Podarcis raffonei]|uniref:Probable RNA-binding protein EIF1AD n=1 Tax=Podarcis lilfordi TaxID=74358 RepID=A0AA35LLP9_9SAUR|nr:probable RNA-binding protein EIF1AD isoform X1 [Zootoca vivipara]XP_034954210.1 probable RNA-binding protein EIF1AD isoform X1 [Zootoca vivipara]XP_053224471.1 probable RNA-binding protein EIF1AD isoform X1 [Podarcis raffonei]XP_053224472.1 probable RNA-binding protein EIF1AD isoform X1 [Podarcis raffonei]CAI5797849.1 RNA-binding EIF1AD isoform X2 [Podarcis lilfordi]